MNLEFKVLQEILELLDKKIYPSIWKIAKWIWKPNSLNTIMRIVKKLEDDNCINRDNENKIIWITEKWKILLWKNEIKLKNKLNFFDISIIGSISCWNLTEAYEDKKWSIALSEEIIKWNPGVYFILEAKWDSMNNYKKPINEWDYILMKKQNFADNWDVIIALIDNTDATLKEFRKNTMWFVQLIPHSTNLEHRPKIIRENLRIQGIFMENLGNFND